MLVAKGNVVAESSVLGTESRVLGHWAVGVAVGTTSPHASRFKYTKATAKMTVAAASKKKAPSLCMLA